MWKVHKKLHKKSSQKLFLDISFTPVLHFKENLTSLPIFIFLSCHVSLLLFPAAWLAHLRLLPCGSPHCLQRPKCRVCLLLRILFSQQSAPREILLNTIQSLHLVQLSIYNMYKSFTSYPTTEFILQRWIIFKHFLSLFDFKL